MGDTVTVRFTYIGRAIGFVNGQLHYDNKKLEYLSGGSGRGAGYIQLKTFSNDPKSDRIIFKIDFRALKAGVAKLSLETLEIQYLNGGQSRGIPQKNKTISIQQVKDTPSPAEKSAQETQSTVAKKVLQETDMPASLPQGSKTTREGQSAFGFLLGLVTLTGLLFSIVLVLWKLKNRP